MPVQDNEDTRKKDNEFFEENEKDKNETAEHTEKLLPFLKSKAEYHSSRVKNLEFKIAGQSDRISRNKSKLEYLENKIDRLKDMNKILETFGNVPFAKSIIKANKDKIDEIQNKKIPARKKKIKDCEKKLESLTFKKERITHKLNRVLALNDTIRSFSIGTSSERKEFFSSAIDRLKKAQADCLNDKKTNLISKKNKLIEAYNLPETNVVDKYKLQGEIQALSKKADVIDKKIKGMVTAKDTSEKAVENTKKCLDEMADKGNLSMEKLSENAINSAGTNSLEKTEELLEDDADMIDGIINNGKKNVEKENTSEIKSEKEFVNDMFHRGKAQLSNDGGYKINAKYYNELPRDERHIEPMTGIQAAIVMQTLESRNIPFSAASRGNDNVGITVANNDIPALNEIMKKAVGRCADFDKSDVDKTTSKNHKKKTQILKTVNPDYYKSLTKSKRTTSVETMENARKIVKGLIEKNIPYSAVVRSDDTAAVTVSKENQNTYKEISKAVKGENSRRLINPQYFKALAPSQRQTTAMSQQQAEKKIQELEKKGIPHSAVLNGEHSAVTTKKSAKTRSSGQAYFSRGKLKSSAQKIHKESNTNRDKSKDRKQSL